MTELKDFLTEFNGHSSAYSSYMLIGENLTSQVVLNALMEINPDMCVGSGYCIDSAKKGYNVVGFEICKETPDLIHHITRKLNCIGYADTSWDAMIFDASKNGFPMNDFTARWDEGMPLKRDDGTDLYDAFVIVTDDLTGNEFPTGAGAVDKDTKDRLTNLIQCHIRKRNQYEKVSKRWDILRCNNNLGGRQAWAYIGNSHEVPVLVADADLPQEWIDYRKYGTVCVKYRYRDKESSLAGTLVFNEGKWQIHHGACCISSSFGMGDILELVTNSQSPVIEKDQIVAVSYYSKQNSTAAIMMFKVGSIDSNCSIVCDLIPLSDEEMETVVRSIEKWCER